MINLWCSCGFSSLQLSVKGEWSWWQLLAKLAAKEKSFPAQHEAISSCPFQCHIYNYIYITCCLSYRWKCSQDLTEISQVTRKLLKRWTLWLTWIGRGFLWSWYWLFMIIRCCSMLFVDSLSSKAWASPQTKTSRLQRQAQIHFNQTFQTFQLVFILFFSHSLYSTPCNQCNPCCSFELSLVFEDDIGLYESFWILILFDWVIEWYWMWLRAPLERFQI